MRFCFHENLNHEEKFDLKSITNKDHSISCNVIQYDELHYYEDKLNSLIEFKTFLTTITSRSNQNFCTWINIDGIHQQDIIDELSNHFDVHQLIKEDIITINERMKLDLLDHSTSIYLLLKMIYIHPNLNNIFQEQISFLLKENNFLITIQEETKISHPFDIFQVVKHRLKNNRGRIRSLKIDYLFYCLFDVLIENYMIVLDHISVKIDMIDKLLMNKLKQNTNVQISTNQFNFETLKLLYHIKHDMLRFRVLCQPLREIIIKLQKAQDRISMANQSVHSRRQYRRKKRPKHITLSGNYFFNPYSNSPPDQHWSIENNIQDKEPLFNEYIFIYFKDLNDHIIQLQDRIDTYCDLLSGLTTFYMIINDAEMNRVMTFLTLVSVIFIPLTFVIGLLSMNFENTPPLIWRYGYFVVLAALGVLAIFMFGLFKWKKWL